MNIIETKDLHKTYISKAEEVHAVSMRTEQGTSSLIRFSATVENHYGPIE